MNENIGKGKKVVVGMSGGVDSSVTAYILKQQGFEVIGLHMKSSNSEMAATDEQSARSVCDKLGIKLAVVSYKDEMQQVIDYFINEYKNGRTPNPCVRCNKTVKFKPFIEYAEQIGADFFATGHYAQIEHNADEHVLYAAVDASKDQTYFLNQLSEEQLSKVLFPLGKLTKEEVREIAEKIGFENAHKKDSYDVCFLGNQKFKDYIAKAIPEKQGDIVECNTGKVVGKHSGLSKYTIGQRKGLGIGGGFGETLDAWFVVKKDLNKNILYVEQGNGSSLFSNKIIVKDFNFIAKNHESKFECFSKFRYRQKLQEVEVNVQEDNVVIYPKNSQRAVTPGQFAVLYKNDNGRIVCLGGGVIEEACKV